MFWRTIAFGFAFGASVSAGERRWSYARLVDAPIAPIEETSAPEKAASSKATPAAYPSKPTGKTVVLVADEGKNTEARPAESSPRKWRVFVGGEVARPGTFVSERPFTAVQGIVAAGGAKKDGDLKSTVVLRYGETNTPPSAARIDLSKTMEGKANRDAWLEHHDVVIVPKPGKSLAEVVRETAPNPETRIKKSVPNAPRETVQIEDPTAFPSK